jgi:N-acetylglucosamine kinase-like BadF-type ATPase
MKMFLGIDGGGSKTECVLMDESGVVQARALGPGTNLRRTSADELRRIITKCREDLRSQVQDSWFCEAVYAGFAGAGDAECCKMAESVLREVFRVPSLAVVGDMEVALEAAVGGGPGVVLVSGTGSIAYGRNAAGQTARAGGEGPAEGDRGSGYAISKAAVEAGLLEAAADAPVEQVAALVEAVNRAAEQGDATAQKILRQAGRDLADLALKVLDELGMTKIPNESITVATTGGAFLASPVLLAETKAGIAAAAPAAQVVTLPVAPAEGAARRAQRLWHEGQGK